MISLPASSSGRLATDSYARHVMARLLDFFADTTPWPRRLWEAGSVLALREALECGDWQRKSVLSSGAVSWYLHALQRQLGPDRGIGDTQLRKELTQLLRSGLPPDGRERRRLAQLIPAVEKNYLARWGAEVDTSAPPSAERLARMIATHLLDCGHSSGQLHRWVRALGRQPDATLADLLDTAGQFARRADHEFEVLAPFVSVPNHEQLATSLNEWCSAQRTARWFTDHGFTTVPRHNGAFRYRITAKDSVAAARAVGGIVQRMEGRRSYARGSTKQLRPVGKVWVAGCQEPLPLKPPERGVNVLSLESEKTMYDVRHSDRLDEALELAAPLNAGPEASAVAGAWAAVESLLFHPGDNADSIVGRAVAADRLAAIVACSWPRAELTTLSYRHAPDVGDETSATLGRCGSNLERCAVVVEALAAGKFLALTSPSDVAAAERMRVVLGDPRKQLQDVRCVFDGVFRRFYRQRNIVMHGGSTAGVALDSALRTAAPLIGAGLDRLVHAQLIGDVQPLDLAARAENSLALADDPLGPAITALLE